MYKVDIMFVGNKNLVSNYFSNLREVSQFLNDQIALRQFYSEVNISYREETEYQKVS
jgi:hypothetical protein